MDKFLEAMATTTWYPMIRAVIALVVGLVVAHVVRAAVARVLKPRVSPQHAMLGVRAAYYVIVVLALLSGLRELGFDFAVLLGAAGIASVAIGFASQTSASNLISGLFLISEQPFVVGEVIRVGDTTGEVVSVDLLSVKLRTFDNLFVRVPNESLVKSANHELESLSHPPIRSSARCSLQGEHRQCARRAVRRGRREPALSSRAEASDYLSGVR